MGLQLRSHNTLLMAFANGYALCGQILEYGVELVHSEYALGFGSGATAIYIGFARILLLLTFAPLLSSRCSSDLATFFSFSRFSFLVLYYPTLSSGSSVSTLIMCDETPDLQ
jgi:hypothetical protein